MMRAASTFAKHAMRAPLSPSILLLLPVAQQPLFDSTLRCFEQPVHTAVCLFLFNSHPDNHTETRP